MKRIKLFLILSIVFFMGCATGYNQTGFKGGYSETQVDVNVYEVTFVGNGYTSIEQASDFNLLRCSELTIANGYNYFVIRSQGDRSNQVYMMNNYGGNINMINRINKPGFTRYIEMLMDKPEGLSYNAIFVYKNIKDKYNIE